jgi:hypothetical protein
MIKEKLFLSVNFPHTFPVMKSKNNNARYPDLSPREKGFCIKDQPKERNRDEDSENERFT